MCIIKMTHLYLAPSFDELEKQATWLGDIRNLLNDAKACSNIYKKALECIDVQKTKKKDEELACVLCIQLEIILQEALDNATTANWNRNGDSNSKKLYKTLSNNLQTAKEIGAPLKKSLKSRYEGCLARQHNARHLIEGLFSDRPSRSSNDQSSGDRSAGTPSVGLEWNQDSNLSISKIKCTERQVSPPAHSSTDLASAALNDLPSDQKVDMYLGSSIADLEHYASTFMDGWQHLTSHNVDKCITVGDIVLEALKAVTVRGDEELQFVLNKLLAAYMQRSKDASHKLINGELDDADDNLFASYIDPAQRRYKLLEESLQSRYNQKNALKLEASYLILSPATLEKWSESWNEPTHCPKSNLSQLTLHASAKKSQSEQQSTENHQPDEKPCILPSQPSTELHSPTEVPLEAPIAQAVDDVGFGSLASTGRDVLDRADHALGTVDSLSVLTSACTIVAAGGHSVAVAAASPTAAAVAKEPASDSSATVADAPPDGTKDNNACAAANPQRPSLHSTFGIVNGGNDCYMTTIIQTLNIFPGFQEFVNELAEHGSHRLASELAAILRRLKYGTVADMRELKNVLGTMSDGEKWVNNTQQDAHDFLTYIFSKLEQDAGSAPTPKDDGNRPTGGRRCFVKEQTEFTVRSVTKCNVCDSTSSKEEPTRCLLIYISHGAEEIQILQDCLKMLTQPEPVQFCCGNASTKKDDLISLPNLLIVYVKRFVQKSSDESTSSKPQVVDHKKLKRAIIFPTENLDLRSLMPGDCDASNYGLYRLIGIVNHHGDELENGHYTAHCKNLNDGEWYLFDDSTVTHLPVADASATDAYILFYSNCSLTTTQL